MSGAAREALIGSIGVYCKLIERPLTEERVKTHLVLLARQPSAQAGVGVYVCCNAYCALRLSTGYPRIGKASQAVDAPSTLPTKLETQPDPELVPSLM